MAFLTTQRGSGNANVATALREADQAAIDVKNTAANVKTRADEATLRASDVIALLDGLERNHAILQRASDVPGIVPAAQDQYADVADYDVKNEFTNMIAEIEATASWLEANYPQVNDGSEDFLKSTQFVGDGSGRLKSYTGYAANELTAISNRMTTLLATID